MSELENIGPSQSRRRWYLLKVIAEVTIRSVGDTAALEAVHDQDSQERCS
jgi:hypothetical protein